MTVREALGTGAVAVMVGDWFDGNWEFVAFVVGLLAIGIAAWRHRASASGPTPAKTGATKMPFWSNWFKPSAASADAIENAALKKQVELLAKQVGDLMTFLHQSTPAAPNPAAPAPSIAANPLPDAAAPAPVAAPTSSGGTELPTSTWPRAVKLNGITVTCNNLTEFAEYASALKETP